MKQILSFILLFLLYLHVNAQQRTITGTVTSSDSKEPLPGVSISVAGTTSGTVSDMDGKFSISVEGSSAVLVFSYVGYIKEEVQVGSQTEINVSLNSDLARLDEVVVVGYGVQRKSLVTGAISKVSGDDLTTTPDLRINQMLQGKASGVVIMNGSGQPGTGVSVRIRGVGTNGNNEPLYLVDGLPLSDAGIDFINPSDVESVEVLKDAASSSIYGTRAANGVILITTKKGKAGKMQVNYDGYYGLQNPWRKLDLLNSREYMMLINEAAANGGKSPLFSQQFMDTVKTNTDWQDQMFNYDAPIQTHIISINGGDDKTLYSSSLSYFGQDGIVAKGKSNFERYAFRLNVTKKMQMLELGSNLNFANITNRGIDPNNQYGGSSLIQALNNPPIVPVKNPDGTWGTPKQVGFGLQEITNPVAMMSYLNSTTNTNKFIGNLYAALDFGKIARFMNGLSFRTNYSTEYSFVNGRSYNPQYTLDDTHSTTEDGVNQNIDRYRTWNFENTLTYDKTLAKHHFTLLLGQSAYETLHTFVNGSRNQVIFNDLEHAYLDNATSEKANAHGGYGAHTLASYFGRLNYDFDNKYLLTAIVRRDGSSRFGPNNKYATFPSLSLGWVVSREEFMKPAGSYISFMKIRGSWGQNGNELSDDFMYTSTIGSGSNYFFGTDKTMYHGTQPSVIPNPNLLWETSEQLDLGLDIYFFENKLTLTADYYNKTTKDWLVRPSYPLMIGNTPPYVNGGNIRNRGIEADLGYKNNIGKFRYEFNITAGYNKNEVLEIHSQNKRLQGGNGGFGQSGIVGARIGEPMGSFYGVKTAGIFQNQAEIDAHSIANTDGTRKLIQPNAKPGDVIFVDQNNDGIINDQDWVNLGNPLPDFTGGLNVSLAWAGLDFNMFWYASLGNEVWDANRRYDINYTNYRTDALDRWIGEGTSNSYPRVTLTDNNNNWQTPSDMYVKDASFARLRSITLGYTFPVKVSQAARIQKFRIYVSAENLMTFTKYRGFDPEIGGGVFNTGIDYGNYPQARTILAGINLSF